MVAPPASASWVGSCRPAAAACVCVANVTRGGGGGGGGSGVLANASVGLIATSGGGGGGGGPTTSPCIFPQACAPSGVASLRALPPTNFTLRIALPALPSTLVVPSGVRVSLPPTAVDVGLDQFPAVAAVAVPALTAGGGAGACRRRSTSVWSSATGTARGGSSTARGSRRRRDALALNAPPRLAHSSEAGRPPSRR